MITGSFFQLLLKDFIINFLKINMGSITNPATLFLLNSKITNFKDNKLSFESWTILLN